MPATTVPVREAVLIVRIAASGGESKSPPPSISSSLADDESSTERSVPHTVTLMQVEHPWSGPGYDYLHD